MAQIELLALLENHRVDHSDLKKERKWTGLQVLPGFFVNTFW